MRPLRSPRVERMTGYLCGRSRRPRCERLDNWLCVSCGWSQPADDEPGDSGTLALFTGPADHTEDECHRRQIDRARRLGLPDPTTNDE